MDLMKTIQILKTAKQEGLLIRVENGILRVKAPKGAKPSKVLIKNIRENKASILDLMQRDEVLKNTKKSTEPLEKANPLGPDTIFDTLHNQKREFLMFKMGRRLPANLSDSSVLENVEPDVIKKVIVALESKHESLRTLFGITNGQITQKVYDPGILKLQYAYTDLRKETEQTLKKKAIIDEAISNPFDLENEPLYRVRLIQLATTKFHLVFVLDHMITEARSAQMIQTEFMQLYEKAATATILEHANADYHPRDYAAFYNEHHQSRQKEFHSSHFEEMFGKKYQVPNYGFPTLTNTPEQTRSYREQLSMELETFKPIPETLTIDHFYGTVFSMEHHKGRAYRFALPTEIVEGLQHTVRKTGTNLYLVILAAYALFLGRQSKLREVTIRTPVDTGDRSEFSEMLTWFTGAIFLKINLLKDQNFIQLIKQCQQVFLEGLDHKFYPLEKIMEDLDTPLECLLTGALNVVQDVRERVPHEKEFEEAHFETASSPFHVSMILKFSKKHATVWFEYRQGLFEKEAVSEIGKEFVWILEKLIKEPEMKLGALVFPELTTI